MAFAARMPPWRAMVVVRLVLVADDGVGWKIVRGGRVGWLSSAF